MLASQFAAFAGETRRTCGLFLLSGFLRETSTRPTSGPSNRLGGTDEAAVQARPSDEELIVIEDFESEVVTAGRARALVCCGHLHLNSVET